MTSIPRTQSVPEKSGFGMNGDGENWMQKI